MNFYDAVFEIGEHLVSKKVFDAFAKLKKDKMNSAFIIRRKDVNGIYLAKFIILVISATGNEEATSFDDLLS